jgi:histidyl-tRNA synthetase
VKLQAVKGTRDILPDQVPAWHQVENAAHAVCARYGYREIRTPMFEVTEVFARGIGAETDIVAKEMYTFSDPGGESLTLRPEATAGIVRAVIEHNLVNEDPALKVYALGPMFRRERPQKGRYRQFHQFDVEAFGTTAPAIDVEIVELALRYLHFCGLRDYRLVLNSVGDGQCRPAYVEALRDALRANSSKLGPDSQRRTETNPLRVLDSKAPEEQELIGSLPKITDALCADCRDHFAEVCRQLGQAGIPYAIDARLVRGLDYYVRTTFEITSGELGAQNSVLGGGRYDGLVKQLGGPDVSGIGFALGLERLVMLLPQPPGLTARCRVFLAPLTPKALDLALTLQRELRAAGVPTQMSYEGRGLKSQMKLADKLGARFALLLGDDEIAKGVWTVRDMGGSSQEPVAAGRILEHLKEKLSNG